GIDGEGIARIATSHDAGASWSAGAPIEGAEEPGVVTGTADGGAAVWSAPGIGVQVSTDDGQTWEQASGIDGFARVEADRVDPQLVHAWSDGAMYTSTDGGLTFAQTAGADATTVLPGGGEMNLTTVPGVAGEVWAAGGDTEGDGDGVYGLFRSTDGGNSWEELAGFDAADVVGFGAAAPGRDRPTIFTSAQRDGERGIFRSVDGGETWQRINDDQHQWGVTNAAITGDPDEFGRVYIATNGRGIIVGDTEQLPTDGGDEGDRPETPPTTGLTAAPGRFPRVGPTALSTTRSTAPQVTTPPPRGIPDRPRTRGHTPHPAGPWPGPGRTSASLRCSRAPSPPPAAHSCSSGRACVA